MAITTINELWAANLENLRAELAGCDNATRYAELRALIAGLEDGPSRQFVHDALESEIGAHDVLDVSTDDAGRYVVVIARDARREFLREDLDGSRVGPMSEGNWLNMLASEKP